MKFKIAQVLFLITSLWSAGNFLETQNPSTGQLPNISVSDFLADSPSLPEGLIKQQPDNPKELQSQGQGSKRSHQCSQQESKNDLSSSCQSKIAILSNTNDIIQTRPEEPVTDINKLTIDSKQTPNTLSTNITYLDGQLNILEQESTRYNQCGSQSPEETDWLSKLYLLVLKQAWLDKKRIKPCSSEQSSSSGKTDNLTPQSMPVEHKEKPPLIRLEEVEIIDETRLELFLIAQQAWIHIGQVVINDSAYVYSRVFEYIIIDITNKIGFMQRIEDFKTFTNIEIVKLLCVMNKIIEVVHDEEKKGSHNPSLNSQSWTTGYKDLVKHRQQYQQIMLSISKAALLYEFANNYDFRLFY